MAGRFPRQFLRAAAFGLSFVALTTGARAVDQAWRSEATASFDETWQTINDTFYDPTFRGLDWPAVREEYRPQVTSAASAEAARDVIRAMLARLGQSHFGLLSATSTKNTLPGEASVPIQARVVGGDVLVTRVDAEVGSLRPGDAILAIDGTPASALAAAADAAVGPRARALALWQAVNRALHGAPGSTARLRVRDAGGSERSVDAPRVMASGEVVRFGNLPTLRVRVDTSEATTPAGRRVGVIGFNVWMGAVNGPLSNAIDRFRNADGLVIDLRGNPGGLAEMMRGVAGHLVNEPLVLGRMKTRAADLEFKANPRRSTVDGRTVDPFAGPVAILVDELTGSTSECFAGALQALGRARVFGRRTMGQALPALTKRLPNGDALMYVIGDFVTSTGRAVEGDGVAPDEPVTLSAQALSAGRDPDLEAALRWLDAR